MQHVETDNTDRDAIIGAEFNRMIEKSRSGLARNIENLRAERRYEAYLRQSQKEHEESLQQSRAACNNVRGEK